MRARARAFCEDSRRRVLEDDTSNARVDVFRARMCSFCALGVGRGGSLVGEKELAKETQKNALRDGESPTRAHPPPLWGTFLSRISIFFSFAYICTDFVLFFPFTI